MPNHDEMKPAKHNGSKLSYEERLELSLQLLKDLKPLEELAHEGGYKFLSFLLGMAVMETQSIASGDDAARAPHCEHCGSSYDGTSRNLIS